MRRDLFRLGACSCVVSLLAAVLLWAHEGHEGVAPTFRQVQLGSEQWRIGLGTVPADPLIGDEVRIELKAETVPADEPSRLAELGMLRLLADSTALTLKPTNTEGVFGATLLAESAGAVRLTAEVTDAGGATASADFSMRVRPGAAGWLQPLVLIAILMLLASPGLFLSRDVRRWWDRGSVVRRGILVGTALAVIIVMLPVSAAIARALAVALAPQREGAAVDWVVEAPVGGPHIAEAVPEVPLPGALNAGELDPAQIVARVMAPPDRTAQVVVPMPGRIFPPENRHVTVGTRVTKGQTLVRLQPSYIMHDALHLINQRWPILLNAMTARRQMLRARTDLDRLKAAAAADALGESPVQAAEARAAAAKQEFDQWSRTLTMHDEQIKDDQPRHEELVAPVSGEITVANFAQGQLVYEGQPLFTIVDLTTVWVEVRVPERFASRLRRDEIVFRAPSTPGLEFRGRLHLTAPAVDPQSRTLSYFYTVANPRGLLRHGMVLGLNRQPVLAPNESEAVRVLGRVAAKPELQAQVVAPIWGRVEFPDKAISVGQAVKKGQPLARIILELSASERYLMDSRKVEITAAAALAETRRQQAERDYQRAVAVLKVDPSNPVCRADVIGTQQLLRFAEQEQSLFDRQVEAFDTVVQRRDPRITVVEAPIAGTLTALNVRPGDLNETDRFLTLATVTDLSRVWIEAEVFERDVTRLINGARATAITDDGVSRELGLPLAILPGVDEQTRRVKAVFEVPNPDGRLRLGMTVHVAFDPSSVDGAK